MARRIKATEAVRLIGVSGMVIFVAIRHGEINERGYDWVDPDEVLSLSVTR